MTVIHYIMILTATVALTAAATAFMTTRKTRRKVNYMLDALEDKELNFRFDEKRLFGRKFNRTLNRLRNIFDKERHEIIEQERFYGQMLDHVYTGVAVIETGTDSSSLAKRYEGRVIYCNSTALSMLGIATFSHIRQLRPISESLMEAFENVTDNHEEKAAFYNESGQKRFSLTASSASIGGKHVKVVAFNDISNDMAETEQESWTKLIRVLTHEIMNTVTPIASLSETLSHYMESDKDSATIKSGLETISQSSRGLIKFVDSYRNLTRVAPPVKRAFFVSDLADRVIRLTSLQAEEAGAVCTYTEKADDILLYADENQISQIVVNLVKNAIQAEATKVEIVAEMDASENVIINVANNGHPISKESQEEIFVPFFTTKQEGTGIGLSLSRQIMRLHNGTLRLTRSDATATIFTLHFK